MKDNGVLPMVFGCIFLFWLFSSPVEKKSEPVQPTDGLIEQVQSVSDSMEHSMSKEPEQEQLAIEERKPEILIFVSKTCPPCEKWKRVEMQKFIDAGWKVGIVEVHRFSITPTFEITASETVTHQGYLTFEQAKGKLK